MAKEQKVDDFYSTCAQRQIFDSVGSFPHLTLLFCSPLLSYVLLFMLLLLQLSRDKKTSCIGQISTGMIEHNTIPACNIFSLNTVHTWHTLLLGTTSPLKRDILAIGQ